MIAILEGYRAGLFSRNHWLPNLVAGVIVGVVALPLSMAFAIASGARPEQGIYTAIIGGGLVTLLGGTRMQIAGPTGAFIAILSGITAKYGIAGLQMATLMAGFLLLAMGLFKLGALIRYIPAPVIVGFTAGIGVIIFVGQWSYFFGLPAPQGEHFHQKLVMLLASFSHIHWATTALASVSLFLILTSNKVKGLERIPGPLVAMVAATVVQTLHPFDGVATIGTAFGGIPQGLPSFAWPSFSLTTIWTLFGSACAIALLGAIESLLSAVVADGMAKTNHDSNQELIGQGLANIVAPLFGGFAATGAIARTATNIRNGASGPLAGIVHALTLIGVLLVLAPFAANIPLAALAAILFVVAWNMWELPRFMGILRQSSMSDRLVLVVTFLLTVFFDLVLAVFVGVILAFLEAHFFGRVRAT
jgi:SulP family sulfate permease